MIMENDDKRLIPEFTSEIWCERTAIKKWHYCKYCYKEVPVFVFIEGFIGSREIVQKLLCCWECGAGIKIINP